MKFKEIKESTIEQLHKMLSSQREQMRALKFSINSRQEKNVRKLRAIRKTISQILTILNNKREEVKEIKTDKK